MSQTEWRPYGNLKVLCNGKLLVHPVRPWWWLLEIYTVVGLGVFVYEYPLYSNLVIAGGLLLGVLSLLGSFKTTLSDPGVLPKPMPEMALLNESEANEIIVTTRIRRVVKEVTTTRTGETENHFYCQFCQHFRPPGCFHCNICDCCVKGLDHHCPVIGSCIGENNTFWFYITVAAMPGFWIYLFISSTIVIVASDNRSDSGYPLTLACVLLGFLGSLILPPILKLFPCIDRVHNLKPRKVKSVITLIPHPLSLKSDQPSGQSLTSGDEQNANEYSTSEYPELNTNEFLADEDVEQNANEHSDDRLANEQDHSSNRNHSIV